MDQFDFRQKLLSWGMNARNPIIPTIGEIKLYGHHRKTKIISPDQEHLIYACIKPFEISQELFDSLHTKLKMTDVDILHYCQKIYEHYLKATRRQILSLQKDWSRNFAQFRAKQIIRNLAYDDIYNICDLANDRIVPIELILKKVFEVTTKYGDHRRMKSKDEVYVDPRVMEVYKDLKQKTARLI